MRTDRAAALWLYFMKVQRGKESVLTLDTGCDDTLQLELRQNGELYWRALSCVDFLVSRVGVPGFDKRDAWDNKVHCTIWRLWGGEPNCCLYVG